MDLKALREEFMSVLDQLRKAGEERDNEIKKHGEATAETKSLLEKLNNRLDELEVKIKRMDISSSGSDKKNEGHKAFLKFVREGKASLSPEERKALVQDATGEILVPEAIETEIYRELPKLTVIRNLATVRTIGTNKIRRRSLTEVTMGWGKLETGTAIEESTLTPSEAYQYVEDLYGLTKIGEDELMDTDVNLEATIRDSFARAKAEAEDTAFIAGTGHNNKQPEGILNGTTVTRVTAGQVAAITADDMVALEYAVPAQYRKNGVYIVNSTTEQALRLLKDSNGRYLWQPSLVAGRPATFNGRPMYNQDDIPGIPTAAAGQPPVDVAIFGDIKSGYRILDRLGLTIKRLNELYAEDGLIGFKAHFRVGGGIIRPQAMRILEVPRE